MNKRVVLYLGVFLVTFSLFSCSISLKGISINPEVQTFYVADFKNNSTKGPSDLHNTFSEALRLKIRKETRLTSREIDADIIFEGAVVSFEDSGQAASGNDQSAYNRLTITVKVDYSSSLDEKDTWNQSFKFYKDFPTDQSLQDVEEAFIDEIFNQITEDIFNKAFTNW